MGNSLMSEESEEEQLKVNDEYCEESDWDSGSDSEPTSTQYEQINLEEKKVFDVYLKQLEEDEQNFENANWRKQMIRR